MEKGMIIVNTGNGKGKTTSAFGQALRVSGHGGRVCIIQFIKGKWQTGEVKAMEVLSKNIEVHVCGTGFTWEADDQDVVAEAGRKGWQLAREKICSGKYRLVILDEITYLLNYGVIPEDELLRVLQERPAGVDVLLTGRGAGRAIIEAADLVTEMREIKHPYSTGVAARKGVEF